MRRDCHPASRLTTSDVAPSFEMQKWASGMRNLVIAVVDVDRFVNFFAADLPGRELGRVAWPARSWPFRDDVAVPAWRRRGGRGGWPTAVPSRSGRARRRVAAAAAELGDAELFGDPDLFGDAELMAALVCHPRIGGRRDVGHDVVFSGWERSGGRAGRRDQWWPDRGQSGRRAGRAAVERLTRGVAAMAEQARPAGIGTGVTHPACHDEKGSRR